MLKSYAQHVSGGLTLVPGQIGAIETLLLTIIEEIPAQFSMITDSSGQNIACKGKVSEINLVTLGALIASALAASQEIARVTGEYRRHHMILHEGEGVDTFLLEAGSHLVLFAQVPSAVPLGWSRKIIRDAGVRVEKIITEVFDEPSSPGLALHSDNLTEQVSNAIEDLFVE